MVFMRREGMYVLIGCEVKRVFSEEVFREDVYGVHVSRGYVCMY